MPNKRSKRNKTQQFSCPYCDRRLWRQGSQKHYLFYQETSEIKERLHISRKNASFLAANSKGYVDTHSWIEEFFCEKHGRIWMRLHKNSEGKLAAALAKGQDWKRTTHTFNPETPNPSVSEYSYRMSRGSYYGEVKL